MKLGEGLTRRQLLKLIVPSSIATLAVGYGIKRWAEGPIWGDPWGVDSMSSSILDRMQASLVDANLDSYPELYDYTELDWLFKNPRVTYGMRYHREDAEDRAVAEARVYIGANDHLHFRMHFEDLPVQGKAWWTLQQADIVHELRHCKGWYENWNALYSRGLRGTQLQNEAHTLFHNPEYERLDEFRATWAQDVYTTYLAQDPSQRQLLQETFLYDRELNGYDKLAVREWLIHNRSWHHVDYQWLFERGIFTTIQTVNDIYAQLGQPSSPYPELRIRDAEISPEFVDFLTSPTGGGLNREVIDLFETNPEMQRRFENPLFSWVEPFAKLDTQSLRRAQIKVHATYTQSLTGNLFARVPVVSELPVAV